MTEVVAPIHGRRLDARFSLLEKLGSGGQGEVWRAHDDTRGIDIALKVPASADAPNQSVLAAFEREYAIAARLNHSSVLKVFPPHRSGDLVVLPMELATGGDLRRLRGAGYLDIVPVLLDIAQALEHAHERGVIHRDLKPGNVLFDARGQVKLADFGAAGTTSTTAADARMQGLSPFTASPEQLRGEAPTESDDIYGLGALAYELLSGYPPYYPHFDLRRAKEEPVPPLVPTRQIPPLLTALVMRMLAKNRNERPRSMREVIDELDTALNDTLAFDFESIVDPAHGAPSAAVLVGPPPASRPVPAAAKMAGTERAAEMPHGAGRIGHRPPAASGTHAELNGASRNGHASRFDDDSGDDDSDDHAGHDEDAPDLGLIPELLVANALVAKSPAKSTRSTAGAAESRASAPSPTATSAQTSANGPKPTAPQPRKPDGQAVNNDTIYLPPEPESAARGVQAAPTTRGQAASWRASTAQTANNDTMQLSPETAPIPRGVGAAWRVSNTQTVNNDTMQLPPEPAQTRGLGAAWRASTARAAAAVERPSYGQAANEQSIRARPATPIPASTPTPIPSPKPVSLRHPDVGTPEIPAAQVQAPPAAITQFASNPASSPEAAPHLTVLRQAPGPQLQPGSPAAAGRSAGSGVAAAVAAGPSDWVGDGNAVGSGGVTGPAAVGGIGGALDGHRSFADERPLWESLQLDTVPRVARLEPIRRRHWPVVLLGVLAGIAVAVFYWLPRYTTQSLPFDLSALSRATQSLAPSSGSTSPADATTAGGASDAATKLQSARDNFDRRLAVLETRGAGVWGGPEFGLAKSRAAESVGARDAGNTQLAQERLTDASRLLDAVESKAPQALAAELAVGERALAAGQEGLANQAFDLARRIDPNDKRIAEGQRHTHNLSGVLPLLADGQNAENARNYSRAAQDYSQALSIDPGNDKARAGLARANAAFGDDNYAKAVGSGFAALGAGRLDDAHDAFEKARTLRPNGSEAAEGLRRVGAALSTKGFTSLRQRAAGLEAQERWDEAIQVYDSALQADPSLAFAQEGKDRAAARAELGASMQALIDRPERLTSPSLREQAKALLDTANQQSPSGPVLRSQIARLGILVPDYDSTARSSDSVRTDLLEKPVRLSLLSDNATAVAIPSIGQFGTFAKRDIQLKPGRYTVIGTRDGFRDVHRDITIAPGQESQTISVSCSDPI
jgi:serine/threonine protein kinase/tetratricopeptide (TPR) repeat protein